MDRSNDTLNLVQKAKAGDDTAINELLRIHEVRLRPLVKARLGRALRRHMDTQDVLNSALRDAFVGLERFEPRSEGAFLNWLAKIACRKIADKWDYYKAEKRGGGMQTPNGPFAAEFLAAHAGKEPSPSEAAVRNEAEERLYSALETLDEPKREAFVLARIQRLPLREVGEILGCSEDAARMRVVRAERALAECYLQ